MCFFGTISIVASSSTWNMMFYSMNHLTHQPQIGLCANPATILLISPTLDILLIESNCYTINKLKEYVEISMIMNSLVLW